jgi:RNA polymerase sigma-70 factor (ECF subfamily)
MNPEEFKIQVLPLKNKLYRLALRLLGKVEEAEDSVQDTLLKLWTKKDELENFQSVEAFAMTVTRNLCLDKIKSKAFQVERLPDQPISISVQNDPSEVMEYADMAGLIRRIVDELPEQQRSILQMRDIEEMEYEQIAEVLQMNVNAIRVNLSRARKKVRDTVLKIQGYELASN